MSLLGSFGTGWARLSRRAFLAAASGLLLASCGGGGSRGGSSLDYLTDWTNRSRGGVTGLSQRVQLFNSQGALARSAIVNQDVNGVQTARLSVNSGTYHLFVELFSARDLGGVKTGELDAWVDIQGATTFRTSVGLPAVSVKVTPQTATLQVEHTKQFYATGYNGPSDAVFVEVNGFSWTTLGGTSSVSQDGLLLATSEGSGSVRATHISSSIQGSAIITVTPFTTTTGKWTIIVFLNAANDLAPFSRLNVNQMESVAQNPDVRFVLQWKTKPQFDAQAPFDGTRRYLVKPDNTNALASELIQDMGQGVDMGDPNTMRDFINWAKTFYPAQRYVVVVWNHGNGWRRGPDNFTTRAVSYDDETGNAIQTWEISQAIGNNVIDILAWDASLMQMMEVAYEAKDRALFIAGSEESPPGEGYPYQLIFDNFRDNPDATTQTLSKAFVDGMLAVPAYQTRKITQSVIDTSQLPALATAIDSLASQLILNEGSIGAQIVSIRNTAQSYSPTAGRVYRDLYHVCQLIESQIGIAAIQTAAANVRAAITSAVIWEGHNTNSPNSHGIAIDFSSSSQFASVAADYALLSFAANTQWNEWLAVAP